MLNKADLEGSCYFTCYLFKFLLYLVWCYEGVNIWENWK